MGGRLVLISGHPATGKTTLGRRLGADLGVPVIHRDGLRRRVLFPIAEAMPEVRALIPSALDRMVVAFAETIFDAGGAAILDGNFNNPAHGAAVKEMLARRTVTCFEVCLWGEPDELRRRFIERADPPLTDDLRPYFDTVVGRDRVAVLDPPTPVVHIDTTDITAVDERYGALLAEIRAELALGAAAGDPEISSLPGRAGS